MNLLGGIKAVGCVLVFAAWILGLLGVGIEKGPGGALLYILVTLVVIAFFVGAYA
jgi:uncharacterized membrane protein YqaE (UPF0057 family)